MTAPVRYEERRAKIPAAVVWTRRTGPEPERLRILPDGCIDIVWDGHRLFVAGPDPVARWHPSPAGTAYVGLRMAAGVAPAALGVAAVDLVGRTPALDDVWPSAPARRLAERVASDPAAGLEEWLTRRLPAAGGPDPLGGRVHAMAAAGLPVATMAERLGVSDRQLQRRCLAVFGYGPRRLRRVLRLGRAVDAARRGVPLATVAAECGYTDQAHLSREIRDLAGTTPGALVRELAEAAAPRHPDVA